jgi:hypothetical protein
MLANLRPKLGRSGLPRFRRKTFCANTACLQFAARLAARVNVRAMRKTRIRRKCFAAFEFSGAPRTAHRPRTLPTSHNCLMQRLNLPRIDRRSKLVAHKPFNLLDFQPHQSAKNPQNSGDRRNSVATRLRFAARPGLSGRFAPPQL